jgi:hypothetical protein
MPKKESVKENKERLIVEEQKPLVEPVVVPEPAVVPEPVVVPEPAVVPEPVVEFNEEIGVKEKRSVPKWLLFIVGLVIGLMLGVGVVLAWGMYSNKQADVTKSETAESEVTPVPVVTEVTPTPELVRSKLKIRVENGGGVKGAAAKASEFLTGLGYTVVSTGNSDKDVKLTEVSIVSGKSDYKAILLKDLDAEYEVASAAGELGKVTEYDALVTVGQ